MLVQNMKTQKGVENEEDIEKCLILHSAKENHVVARNRRGTRIERKGKRRRRFNFNFPILMHPMNFYTVAMSFKCIKHMYA